MGKPKHSVSQAPMKRLPCCSPTWPDIADVFGPHLSTPPPHRLPGPQMAEPSSSQRTLCRWHQSSLNLAPGAPLLVCEHQVRRRPEQPTWCAARSRTLPCMASDGGRRVWSGAGGRRGAGGSTRVEARDLLDWGLDIAPWQAKQGKLRCHPAMDGKTATDEGKRPRPCHQRNCKRTSAAQSRRCGNTTAALPQRIPNHKAAKYQHAQAATGVDCHKSCCNAS